MLKHSFKAKSASNGLFLDIFGAEVGCHQKLGRYPIQTAQTHTSYYNRDVHSPMRRGASDVLNLEV